MVVAPARFILALIVVLLLSNRPASPQVPPDPKTLFGDAERALVAHDYPQAEIGFRKYLEMDPGSAAGYSNLGVVYMRLARYDSAIEAFHKAKALAPGLPELDLNLGLAYYHEEEFVKAIPAFERVIDLK